MARHTDLRDLRFFPTFADCPDENDISLDFYELRNDSFLRPRRHWCLLAEIAEVEYFVRLRLIVKDNSGVTFPIAFYLDDETELHHESFLKGHTLAILYPHQHSFLDGTVGIRQEEIRHIKASFPKESALQFLTIQILTTSLSKLMSMSDEIQSSAARVGGKQACHACGTIPDKALKCARCQFFWYCDKKCQEEGWHVKGHKQACKVLKDEDMQGIIKMEWEAFDDFWRFPLRSPHAD